MTEDKNAEAFRELLASTIRFGDSTRAVNASARKIFEEQLDVAIGEPMSSMHRAKAVAAFNNAATPYVHNLEHGAEIATQTIKRLMSALEDREERILSLIHTLGLCAQVSPKIESIMQSALRELEQDELRRAREAN